MSPMAKQMMLLRNLNCPNCAAKLEKAARQLPGMESARVAFATGTLHVQYDQAKLTEAGIRDLVRQFGLEVSTTLSGG